MRCQVRKVDSVKELNAGELLMISPIKDTYRAFRSDIFYGVKEVAWERKCTGMRNREPFAVLYVYDSEAARSNNPKLYASNTPLLEREINTQLNIYKVLAVIKNDHL